MKIVDAESSAFVVYVLYSEKNDTYYIGYTSDLARRIEQHNNGLTQSTKGKGLWKIVYTEQFDNKTDAIKRERFLKKQKNKAFYKKLIDSKDN